MTPIIYEHSPAEREIDLARWGAVLRRRWWAGALVLVVCAAVAVWAEQRKVPEYQATAVVRVDQSIATEAFSAAGLSNSAPDLRRELGQAQSGAIADSVESRLGRKPRVAVSVDEATSSLEFVATASDPVAAAEAANAWAETFVDRKEIEAREVTRSAIQRLDERLVELRIRRQALTAPALEITEQLAELTVRETAALAAAAVLGQDRFEVQQRFQAERIQLEAEQARLTSLASADVAVIDAQISQISAGIGQLDLRMALSSLSNASLVAEAEPDDDPSNRNLERTLTTALLVGLTLGAGAMLLLEAVDTRIRTADQAGRAAGVPVLATIPKARRRNRSPQDLGLALASRTDAGLADGYERLRSSVRFALHGRDFSSVLITSASPAEGKSTTASNLAWAFSATEDGVALVDADIINPSQHIFIGVDRAPGISDALTNGDELSARAYRLDAAGKRIAMFPAGSPVRDSASLLNGDPFGDEILERASVTVIDSPPVLAVADALNLASSVDAVLLAVRAGHSRRGAVAAAADQLRRVGAPLLGVVLIGATEEGHRYYYYRGYKYRSYRNNEQRTEVDVSPLQPVDEPAVQLEFQTP
jgi:capsular exopolysaccharide synthesis family protein